MKKLLFAFALWSLTISAAHGQNEPEQSSPKDVVEAFHKALGSGDKDKALMLLSPDVVIFESGGAEMSRAEYASHHLSSDMSFSATTHRNVTAQSDGGSENTAWVLTRSELTGRFRDRDVDLLDVETMILERADDGWRIVHIHWSSQSRAQGR